jgi:hypothetical protein
MLTAQAKSLAELQEKLRALPEAERQQVVGAARATLETAPWGQAAAATSAALRVGIAGYEKRGACAAVPTGEGHTGEVDKLRALQAKVLNHVSQTVGAQFALLQDLVGAGGSCCAAKAAKADGPDCCKEETKKPDAGAATAKSCCNATAQQDLVAAHPTVAATKVIAGMTKAHGALTAEARATLAGHTQTLRKHGVDGALRDTFADCETQLGIAVATAGELVDVYAGAADAGCPVSGKNADQHKETQADLAKYREMLAAYRTALKQLDVE